MAEQITTGEHIFRKRRECASKYEQGGLQKELLYRRNETDHFLVKGKAGQEGQHIDSKTCKQTCQQENNLALIKCHSPGRQTLISLPAGYDPGHYKKQC